MNGDQWRKIEDLFEAAQARPPHERPRFLDEHCQGDTQLREELESLLAQETRADLLFETCAWGRAPALFSADATSPAALATGAQLGPYRVVAPLGSGAMGEVYRARDTRLGRDVALKLLPEDCLRNPDRRRRFLQEARLASALKHPNIVSFYDLTEIDGRQILVMEYVAGQTLQAIVRGNGLPLREALDYAVQIADALAAAHKAGIIHRDLKPANVMVSDTGVTLLDFGLAKLSEPAAGDSVRGDAERFSAPATREGVIVGTPSYMSPEQAQGKSVDARSDLFSFGCLLYAMVTGYAPFSGDSAASIVSAVLRDEPKPVAELRPGVTGDIERILRRCLRKDPDRRFQTAADLRAALLDARDSIENAAEVAPDPPARLRLSWPAAAAIGFVLVLIAGAVGWLAHNRGEGLDNPLDNARFTRLTNLPSSEIEAAISRDGKFVAFLSDRDGPFDVWVGQPGSGEFVKLTHAGAGEIRAPYRSIGFAANGSDIWLAGGNPGSRVRLVPLMGGEPRNFLTEKSSNVAWSPDGTRLAYHTRDPGDPLFIADSTGLNAHQIFVSEPGLHNHYPVWSPDGRWIYFVRGRLDTSEMDIWRIPSSGGKVERMTEHNSDVAFPAPIDARTMLYV